jgi:hypothetical protein
MLFLLVKSGANQGLKYSVVKDKPQPRSTVDMQLYNQLAQGGK